MSLRRRPPTDEGAEPRPGADAAIRARNAVERAIAAIPGVSRVLDRAGLGDRLGRAIQCAYAVIDSDLLAPVHHDGLREGAAALREAIALLGRRDAAGAEPELVAALDALGEAVAALSAGEAAVAQIQLDRRLELKGAGAQIDLPPVRPLRASIGLPALHSFPRRPLVPAIELDPRVAPPAVAVPSPKVARPSSMAELAAFAGAASSGKLESETAAAVARPPAADEPAPPPPFAYEPAIEEVEMVRRLARDCLEDIAVHRDLRKPNALETWLDQGPFEQRLLDNLDAFASFGGAALPLISLYHAEAKAPDPGRAFAVALTLGAIEGSDTVFAAAATLKQSAPESFPGWIEGLWLAPSPAVDLAMADLCTSARPPLVALALDVLHARGRTPDELVLSLIDRPEPAIARRVLRALSTSLRRADAIDRLERACDRSTDDDLFFAALESLLRRGHAPAIHLLRQSIDAPLSPSRRERALPLLCLAGRASDLDRLLAALSASPSPALLRALGRFGHVDALAPLINLLHGDDDERIAAAAEALARITGAGLRETVEEPWEIELPPEAADAGGIPVPMRKVERIVTDPERWSAWLRDEGRSLDPRWKTRGGVPFTLLHIVDELESRLTPPDRRGEAALELALLSGIPSPFSPHDWVERQRRHLADLREQIALLPASAGAWSFAAARPELEAAEPARPLRPAVEAAPPRSTDTLPPEPPASPLPPALLAPLAPSPLPFAPIAPSPLPFAPIPTAPQAPIAPIDAVLPFRPAPPSPVSRPLSTVPSIGTDAPPRDPPDLAPQPAPPSITAPPSSGPITASSPFLRPSGSVLPFRPPSPPEVASPAPAPPLGVDLSLEQYAALCAELAAAPQASEATFQRYGLTSAQQRVSLDLAWRERLQRNPEEYRRWQDLHRRAQERLAEQARRGDKR